MELTVRQRHNRNGNRSPRRLRARPLALALVIGLPFVLYGCGSGSSSPPPPPPLSFTISVSPSTTSIAPGNSSTVQVSIAPYGDFAGTVSVTVSGLPSGLSASPSSFALQTTSKQSVTIAADPAMATGNYSFEFDGTSGNVSKSATVKVGVGPLQTFILLYPR